MIASSIRDDEEMDSGLSASRTNALNIATFYGTHLRMGATDGSPLNPMSNSKRREIGELAIWQLSSAKQGNGVEQLRDGQVTSFWQSDGQ